MADDEKNPATESPVRDSGPVEGVSGEPGGSPGEVTTTAETSAQPEAGATDATTAEETVAAQEPAADEAVAEPTPEEAAEAAPATGAETSEAAPAAQNPPREKKPRSNRHVPRSE